MSDLTHLVIDLSREEEADLVVRIKAGDQNACTGLVTLFGPQMLTVARRLLRCDDDCNDALQDAFISAFKAIARFEGGSRLSTWLHRITVNSCLMKRRIHSSRKETSIEELLRTLNRGGQGTCRAGVMDDPSIEVEVDETLTLIHEAIDRLPDADRAVLLLRDIEGMDTAATATLLETSEHNVKRRLRRARQALCARLAPMMAAWTNLAPAV